MIKLTDINGRAVCINLNAVTQVRKADASWQGINSLIPTVSGEVIEVQEPVEAIINPQKTVDRMENG